MLKVEELTKDFGGLQAVHHCSFEVPKGAIVGLIGPNGSGKTTTFNLITGFLRPTSGRVHFKGKEITGRPAHEIAQKGIVRTFQLVRTARRMTVMENLLLGPGHQRGEHVGLGIVGGARLQAQEQAAVRRALDLLKVVDLQGVAEEYCGSLPYAEQKIVEIIRALMADPDLILLDEPASGINPGLVNRLLDYIRRLRDEHGKTFLIVEHDMRVIMNLCDRIVVLNYGEKIAEGSPREISSSRAVIDAYLGV
jgi:ABC-type branched-subunit amino acid transport system ATPase component